MRDVNGGPDVEVVNTFPDPVTREDCELYRDMIERLEQAGLCRYRFHLLGFKFFGEEMNQ